MKPQESSPFAVMTLRQLTCGFVSIGVERMTRYRGCTYMWCLGFAGGGDGSSGTWRGRCGALCEGRGGRREAGGQLNLGHWMAVGIQWSGPCQAHGKGVLLNAISSCPWEAPSPAGQAGRCPWRARPWRWAPDTNPPAATSEPLSDRRLRAPGQSWLFRQAEPGAGS